MASEGGVSLPGLAMMAGGLLLAYTAINDVPGGPIGALRSVLAGETPSAGAQVGTAAASLFGTAGSAVGGVIPGTSAGGVAGGALAGAVGSIGAGGSRAKIVSTAQSYLGVPYRFGGASRSGVDCSGLVLLAYKAVGISLPHKASLQAAKGRRIDRSTIKPGDLVAWGAPGNYPHIGIAVNANQVIVAPHTGTVVQYQKLWEKKVPGFGYPDIIRILED
jgi:cell wall-associated NlpC family hydrolase